MRLQLRSKDFCTAMVVRTFEELVLLPNMVHLLVMASECLLTRGVIATVFMLIAVDGCNMSLEVALLSERLLIGATWECAEQWGDM